MFHLLLRSTHLRYLTVDHRFNIFNSPCQMNLRAVDQLEESHPGQIYAHVTTVLSCTVQEQIQPDLITYDTIIAATASCACREEAADSLIPTRISSIVLL